MYVLKLYYDMLYIYHKYILMYILIMHVYVYCSYNESKN
jgi:hypothetical protein